MTLTKTQQKLVKTIQHLHRRGEPLNITAVKRRHPELMEAVYAVKPFWGWKKALAAAGISYADIKVELLDYRECEICKIRRKNLGNHLKHKHSTDADEYRIDYPDADLLCETLRLRRSKAGGLELPHGEPLWTLEYALDRLWASYEKGLPIYHSAVFRRDPMTMRLFSARIGSYDNALKWLGLNPEDIRRVPIPMKSKKEAINAIVRRKRFNLPLNLKSLRHGKNADVHLYYGAVKTFGSWEAAITAAGMDYDLIRMKPKYATPERVLGEIMRRRKIGLLLNTAEIYGGKNKKSDPALRRKACEFFGSWKKTLAAAGIRYRDVAPVRHRRYPTKESVIREIQRRQRAGLPIRSCDLQAGAQADIALVKSAKRFIGRWSLAVERAGFSYCEMSPTAGPYPTPRAAFDEIRRRHQKSLPLNYKGLVWGSFKDRPLYDKAKKVFGSWKKALSAAGIRYKDVRAIWPRRYPTEESVVAEIRRRNRAGLPIRAIDVAKPPHSDEALYNSAIRFYRRWAQAVERAGLSYEKIIQRGSLRPYPCGNPCLTESAADERMSPAICC